MFTVEPGYRCSRCLAVSPTVRVECTCLRLFNHIKRENETPVVYLCLDCLLEAIDFLRRSTK